MEFFEFINAVVRSDMLTTRQWVMDSKCLNFSRLEKPVLATNNHLIIAAAIVELLALRRGQSAPGWAKDVPPAESPIFLVPSAGKRMQARILLETPEPLKKRNVFAPADFLQQI